jgi:hypothetical protein
LDNVQNPLIKKQYRQKIYEKFLKKRQQVDINQEWKNIKNVILESAKETIKIREKNTCNKWWDEECKAAISKKKKKTYKKELEQIKKQARKEANKICKEKKKQWINNRIKQVEEAHKQNDTRKFFKDIRASQNDRSFPICTCKYENGTLKTDKQEIMNRWKQYFVDLVKTDNNINNKVQEVHTIENDTEIEPPTYKEAT